MTAFPRLTEIGTDPMLPDTDGDKINDGVEYKFYNTSPLKKMSDGDLCDDGKEISSISDAPPPWWPPFTGQHDTPAHKVDSTDQPRSCPKSLTAPTASVHRAL